MKRKINRIIDILKSEGFALVENTEVPMSYEVSKSGNLSVMDNLGNYFYFTIKKGSTNNWYTLDGCEVLDNSFENELKALCIALFGIYRVVDNDVRLDWSDKAFEKYQSVVK